MTLLLMQFLFQGSGNCAEKVGGPAFPRLGMWWLDAYKEKAEAIARYDLVLNEFDDPALSAKLKKVRRINPAIKIFRPISPSEAVLFRQMPDGENVPNPEIKKLPSSFFLTETGSILAGNVDEEESTLYVEKAVRADGTPMFYKGGEVAIGDDESALVTAVDIKKKRLTVKRGYIRAAAPHERGERVAMHIRFWPGTWVMNMTAACPDLKISGIKRKIIWLEYYFEMITGKNVLKRVTHEKKADNWAYINQQKAAYDGIIIDRFPDRQSWLATIDSSRTKEIDLYHSNDAATREEFDASCQDGTDILLEALRDKYPGLKIIRNNPVSLRYGSYDGQVYETGGWSSPSVEWWEFLFVKTDEKDYYRNGCYLDWFKNKKSPVVLVEVYEDEGTPADLAGKDAASEPNPLKRPGFKPNYKRMRFSLASALLGDGYYSYEACTAGHGSYGLMWFDEYDNAGAGKGYLGMPLGASEKLENGIYIRKFECGLAACNPCPKPASFSPGAGYRKIAGKQVQEINDGSPVSEVVLSGFDGIILIKQSAR